MLQADFVPHFESLFATMRHFLKADNDINLVLQMVGCLGESFKANSLLITTFGP